MDRVACWATVHGVAKSRTWLSDWAPLKCWQAWKSTSSVQHLLPTFMASRDQACRAGIPLRTWTHVASSRGCGCPSPGRHWGWRPCTGRGLCAATPPAASRSAPASAPLLVSLHQKDIHYSTVQVRETEGEWEWRERRERVLVQGQQETGDVTRGHWHWNLQWHVPEAHHANYPAHRPTGTGDTSSAVSEVDGFKLGPGSVTAARMGFECQSQLKPSVPRPILWPCVLILKIRKNSWQSASPLWGLFIVRCSQWWSSKTTCLYTLSTMMTAL